jgi:hypothetical protein
LAIGAANYTLNRSQTKDDFVSSRRVEIAAASREQFSGPQISDKRHAATTLDAQSRIHNLKYTPLDRRGFVM